MAQINDPANLGINDLFGYKINYNQIQGLPFPNSDFSNLEVKPKYNGNIAEVSWKTATTPNDNVRRYGYVYDGLNRLQAGFYQKDTNPSAQEYFEKLDYDINGNITHLKRSGALTENYVTANAFDDLTYIYENNNKSNRLSTVTDASSNYGGYPEVSGNVIPYDLNGNMTSQGDKGILGIQYNYLNLPTNLTFDQIYIVRDIFTGESEIKNITTQYLYRADGLKLKKKYTFGTGKTSAEVYKITDYLDGFQYEVQGNALVVPALKFVPTSEGYYNFENNKYIYNYTDHLGNVRLSYSKNPDGSAGVLEENNYYPFGLKHEGYNSIIGNPFYQYKYNGKELQTESGMYDYGARMYMADIGRWGVVDPLAETSRRWSPYTYAFNNPIRFIDPDGMENKDIHILGKLAQQGFDQLQASSKLSMEFDEESGNVTTGNLSDTDYNKLSTTDQAIYNGIKNEKVDSQIYAENNNITPEGGIIPGGSFGGATYDKATGKVISKQYVNPLVLGNAEAFTNTPKGTGIVHEVAENALIGRDALNSKSDIPADKIKSPSPMYRDCCSTVKSAMPQDTMTLMSRTTFESKGTEVQWNYELFTPKGTKGTSSYRELIHFKIPTNDKRLKR